MRKDPFDVDPFDLLGVKETDDLAAIREAYRRKARSCHPDLQPAGAGRQTMMKKVNWAWEVLQDDRRREAWSRARADRARVGAAPPHGPRASAAPSPRAPAPEHTPRPQPRSDEAGRRRRVPWEDNATSSAGPERRRHSSPSSGGSPEPRCAPAYQARASIDELFRLVIPAGPCRGQTMAWLTQHDSITLRRMATGACDHPEPRIAAYRIARHLDWLDDLTVPPGAPPRGKSYPWQEVVVRIGHFAGRTLGWIADHHPAALAGLAAAGHVDLAVAGAAAAALESLRNRAAQRGPAPGEPAPPPRAAIIPRALHWDALEGPRSRNLPSGSTLRIGRSTDGCELPLDHDHVSRVHVRLDHCGDFVSATDLGSSNGTAINRVRLRPHEPAPLLPGDYLILADRVVLRCH
jgi:hypothetical protein